jgi:ApaG protein
MHYEAETEGIRVQVRPSFSLARSDPTEGMFVFSYRIEMENRGAGPARLLFRHWLIHDSVGDDLEVDGEGVVGEQPLLGPGDAHSYASFCVLRSPAGYMEGHYVFARDDGTRFQVAVPRFLLEAPLPPRDDDDRPRVMN